MRIRCAICDKLVDRCTIYEDPAHGSRRIIVRCHGDTDTMEMTFSELAKFTAAERRQLETMGGIAFTTKHLAPATRAETNQREDARG